MSQFYHVAVGGEREGPLTQLQVLERIDAGELAGDSLAWYQGLDGWKPLAALEEFREVLGRSSPGQDREGLSLPRDASQDEHVAPPDRSHLRADEVADGLLGDADGSPDRRKPDPEQMAAILAAADAQSQPFRIWTRLGARIVDSILLFIAAFVLFSLAGSVLIAGLGMFFPLVLIASTFLMEAGLLCSFGTTPGKALFGITIRSSTGEILSWGSALRRSLLVWLRGLGLGHPLFALILGTLSYLEVKRRGNVLWDREQNLRVTYTDPTPTSLAVAAVVVFGFATMVVQSGAVGHTVHFMQTGEVPEGLELPEGFELPNRPVPRPRSTPDREEIDGPTA